jgi:nucleoside-diphosphate-sugar epimerase
LTTLVAGGGGFIGGHLVAALIAARHRVRAVDAKPESEWHQHHDGAENIVADLRAPAPCAAAVAGCDDVFNLACDMGGMGFIEHNKARCMVSVLINTHLLEAARDAGVRRYFFASSACVYPAARQDAPDVMPLQEEDAYPADPEDGYGWEKLFSERMCRHFCEDFGVETRVARYHSIFGPHGTWRGGREKAPAAICRKVAEAKLARHDTIEVWGDGRQGRSFLYIDDCIDATRLLAASDCAAPVNIGSPELVSIDQLVDLVSSIAGVELARTYDGAAPQGVRGRSSDNSMAERVLGWQPSTPLADGLAITYRWIEEQVRARVRSSSPV